VALALLATVTLLLRRRAKVAPKLVQVVETTAIGPRRALLVARVGDELLVIGSSEAGLQLLAARPAGEGAAAARLHAVPDAPPAAAAAPAAAGTNPLVTMLARLRGAKAAPGAAAAREPGFDALLAESAEDQELRRKLARGQAGSVR
jgi:flagellar biogenesis protein FliO